MTASTRADDMISTETSAAPADSTAGLDEGGCAVCPHSWSAHDAIGRRFCTATEAGGFARGCVCVGEHGPGATKLTQRKESR